MGMCFGRVESSGSLEAPRNNTVDTEPLKRNTGPIIFVIGAPGLGKRDLGRRLSAKYGFFMISSRDLLEQEIENGSERGRKINEIMKEGKDASADEVVPMVEEKIINQPDALGFLIVGFPRDKRQAMMFNEEVKRPTLVLHLQVRKKVLAERAKNSGRAEEDKKSSVLSERINSYVGTISGAIEVNKKVTKEIDAERKSREEVFVAAAREIDKLTGKEEETKT